jgi:geranylgeranyl diphosphate synthase type II
MHKLNLLAEFIEFNRQPVEEALNKWLPVSSAPGTARLNESLRYAVFPGGKRFRPYVTLIASTIGGASRRQSLSLACAIEFLHTSSIILDDLPAMDNAEIRRNRPALHVVSGEGLAVLVAVALLNQSFALFAHAGSCAGDDKVELLINEATKCIGSDGMIAGQAVDLEFSGVQIFDGNLATRELKTASLMRLMMTSGALISGAPESDITALRTFGECLGKSYQILDDMVDVIDDHRIARSIAQDARGLSATVVESPKTHAAELLARGKSVLVETFGDTPESRLLQEAADHVVRGFTL